MFRTVRLSIIRSLFTVHSAMVYVIQVCRQLSSRTRMELGSILILLEICCRIFGSNVQKSRSQWPRGLRRRSAAARQLRWWFRFPSGAWISMCCECCVLSGGGLCDELVTRPEESYVLWCVVVCDLETS